MGKSTLGGTICVLLGYMGLATLCPADSFLMTPCFHDKQCTRNRPTTIISTKTPPYTVLFQSSSSFLPDDTSMWLQRDQQYFGRGEQHLSALLQEGDVLVYQTGSWYVDGVWVGDDDDDVGFAYCQMETMQVAWTHNCEHGVIRGRELVLKSKTLLQATGEVVEFGPEQLIAKIPVTWRKDSNGDDDDKEMAVSTVELTDTLWMDKDNDNDNDDENE